MDFALNEEQEMFRIYLRKYLDKQGQTKIARDFIQGNKETLDKTMAGLAELGTTAINISEGNGGLGLGTVNLIPVFEETGRALLPGVLLETMAFAVPLLEKYGTEEQKGKYLPEIASGNRTISLAWLEPNGDYVPGDVHCTAKSNGDHFVIDGVKELVPDGDLADTFLTVVRTSGANGAAGISLLLLEKGELMQIDMQQCMDETKHLARIIFDQYHAPKGQVLGELNQGWRLLEEGMLHLNAAISSLLVGGLDKVVEMATEYAKIREQFGGPIGRFQAVKHPIVDMKMALESARSLSYYAAWALENAQSDKEAAIYSARTFATQAFIRAASQNIQIHGGIGFTEEIDCHLFLKRARFFENYLGTELYFHEQIASALGWQDSVLV